MATIEITTPNGRTILPGDHITPERIKVPMTREMLVAALRALWNEPTSDLSADQAYEGLADAYEDLTGEEWI